MYTFEEIHCPYCKYNDYEKLEKEPIVEDLRDGEQTICQCLSENCGKIFIVYAEITCEYHIKKTCQPEDKIIDLPNQTFFWRDLQLGGEAIYER